MLQTDPRVLLAMWASVSATVAAIVAAVLGFINQSKLFRVSIQIDGRMDEILTLTRKSSHAEGVKEQKERESGKDRSH